MARPPATLDTARLKRAWAGWPGQLSRILLAILPLWWILTHVDLGSVARAAASLSAANIIAILAVSLLGYLVGALRWRVLMTAYGSPSPPRVRTLLRHNLVGAWYGLLPSGLANDGVRGFRVRSHLPGLGSSYTVVVVERVSGLFALMVLAMVAMWSAPPVQQDVVSSVLDLGLVAIFGFSAVFLLTPYLLARFPGLGRQVRSIPLLGPLVLRIPPARSLRALGVALALSLVTQGLAISTYFLIGWTLTPDVGLLSYARVVPLLMLLTAIPVTPVGLGQRELLAVYFFGLLGAGAEEAVAISLLYFGTVLWISGLGGAVHLVERLAGWETPAPRSG